MDEIRRVTLAALHGGQAYETIQQILAEIPKEHRYKVPEGMERSAWQILEHMRLSLEDLLAYSTNFDGRYRAPDWPDDYWPTSVGEGDDWDRSRIGFAKAQAQMEDLLSQGDLTKPFPWEPSHCLFRQILLAIEHNAYHAGELVELCRAL